MCLNSLLKIFLNCMYLMLKIFFIIKIDIYYYVESIYLIYNVSCFKCNKKEVIILIIYDLYIFLLYILFFVCVI